MLSTRASPLIFAVLVAEADLEVGEAGAVGRDDHVLDREADS
jgi:hypothetical protein